MFEAANIVDKLSAPPETMADLLSDVHLDANEPLVAQIYRVLWDKIVRVEILPGQLISEKEVADLLQASKTPVREALIRLEDAGVVNVVPKSGTYVSPIRLNSYIEACFTRLQLEIGAVKRAANQDRTHRDLSDLDDILKEQALAVAEERYVDFFALDEKFHKTFFHIAGVPGVWQVMQKTQFDVHRVRHLKRIKKIRRGPALLAEHTRIVDAIHAGDAMEAEQALIAHIGSLEGEIEQLATYPELFDFIEPIRGRHPQRNNRRNS